MHRHAPPPALAQQFAHAHAPTLPSLHKTGLEPRGFFLYRARVAGAVARPQERYHFSVSKPCSTHVASFLFWTSVPLWRAHCSLPFAARIATPARTCARAAHAPTTDDERRDVRSAGVADWKTAERENTERTLTAEAPPPSCDPYRHALTRRPPRKVRLLFLKLLK